MKNILVISEVFKRGGLETQVYTFYKELNQKLNFTFIFGEYNNEWDFGKSKVYTNIIFNDRSSINDFKETVNQIVKIIKKHKIDIIHTHPFHLAIPAIFAAQITKTPICYTYHGFVSVTYPNSINIQTIFDYSLNELFSKVFCVYKNIADYFDKTLINSRAIFLPNPIDVKSIKPASVSNKSKWAMTCRLDPDKLDTIFDTINSLDELDIKQLHIYGSGTCEDQIKDLIKTKKLERRVSLRGYTDNVCEVLKNNYTGVIGMGRSAAEAIAMGLPTMLAGYGRNCGIITKDNYEQVRDNNFAPIFMKGEDYKYVKKQVKEILKNGYRSDIYDQFCEDCSSYNVSKKYLENLENTEVNVRSNFIYFSNEIEKIDSEECFATSDKIYELMNKYLKRYSLDLSLNTTMVYYNSIQKQLKELDSKIDRFNKKYEIKTIKTVEKINAKFLMKNTFRKMKKKIKK